MDVTYLKFDYPIGTNISIARSKSIVLSRKFHLNGKFIAIVENGKILCIATLNAPFDFPSGEFDKYFHLHKLPLDYKRKSFPSTKRFYMYKIDKIFTCLPNIKVDIKEDSVFGKLTLSSNSSLVKI